MTTIPPLTDKERVRLGQLRSLFSSYRYRLTFSDRLEYEALVIREWWETPYHDCSECGATHNDCKFKHALACCPQCKHVRR